jgi:CheY-like chemotaxis protein
VSDQPINILLVDDDDVDIRVVIRALKKQKLGNPVFVAHDGAAALAHLRGEDGKPGLTGPVLVLLDLNMPRMNGHEFLSEIRSDPKLAKTIVFVLTTSNDERDRCAAYERNVAGYLVKSKAGRDLMNHIPLLEQFLLSVRFPSQENPSRANGDSAKECHSTMVEA